MWGAGNDSFSAGGGFVPNQSPAGQAEKTGRGRRSQNIVPVTCKQLLDCKEDVLKIEDTEAHVVTVVGLVKRVETTTTKNSFFIDDQTATIEAVNYVGTDDEGTVGFNTVLVEGTYGRIIGALRVAKGAKYIIIFKVFPISNMNEVTCHAFEVMYAAMKLKKLREAETMKTGVGMSSGLNNVLSNSMIGNNMMGAGPTKGPVSDSVHGLNANQTMVFRVISGCKEESGIHKSDIIQNLKNKLNEKDIMVQIEFLSAEGHIFSTVDDDHYKSTDWC